MSGIGYVQLTVHLVNGTQHRFVQTHSNTAESLLEQLRPERIFSQKQIIIAGADAVTVIPTDNIQRVDLRADPLPGWNHGELVKSIQEITEERFLHLRRPETSPTAAPGGIVGMLAELRDGADVHLGLRLNARQNDTPLTPEDARAFLQHLFSRHVIFGDLDDEQGIFLINPANVVRFVLSPPLPVQSLSSIWSMEIDVL